MTAPRRVLIASNRGPVSFLRDGEHLVASRGAGGLVAALSGAMQRTGGTWISSAISELDAEVAARGPIDAAEVGAPSPLRYLTFDAETYDRFYNGISNRVLWFVHHYLWDLPHEPRFDRELLPAWAAYRHVNRAFADALVEEARAPGAEPVHLVQDYHLSLVPRLVRIRLPHARILHFSHVPFAGSTYIRILPTWMSEELLTGLLGADVVAFQADRWADNFLLACRTLQGTRVNLRRRLVRWEGREVRVRAHPVTIDRGELVAAAAEPSAVQAAEDLRRWVGDAQLIVRADRVELSKNILGGFRAYEALLDEHPQFRGRVRMLAFLEPSRQQIPEYSGYMEECLAAASALNRRFGVGDWEPVRVEVAPDRSMLLAAFGLYDVLLVNPIYDGLNLVAKEGPALNRRQGVLVLSQNAGAFAELGAFALRVNPFDLEQTSDALSVALQMSEEERRRRARGLRTVILRATPERWLDEQLKDLEQG
jgi:trehalose 6-phosphate synthase